MTDRLTRRGFVAAGSLLAAPFLLPSGARPAFAQSTSPRWGRLMPGVSVILDNFIQHHRLDEENGFTLQRTPDYTSVQTYYNDFDVGAYDLCFGSWDTFAVRYLAGVPARLLCLMSLGDGISFAARSGIGIESITDLAGRVVAAPQATGSYRVSRAVLREAYGFNLENQTTVQNVVNPAAAMSVLRAGAAQAALGWEPNVADGLAQDDNLFLLASIGEIYRGMTGVDLPYFAIGVRQELLDRDPEIAERVIGMYRMCVEGILSDVSAAADIVGDSAGFARDVVYESISSGRLGLHFASMTEPDARSLVMTAAEFFLRNELLPRELDEGFFVG